MQQNQVNPHASSQRNGLRLLGFAFLVVGVPFTIVGLISFFSAFGGGGIPSKFWCAFVGLPLVGIGSGILKYAYLGAAMRYVAGETAPIAAASFNYIAEEGRSGVEAITSAVSAGLGADAQAETRSCPECAADCDSDAVFCDQCGHAFPQTITCPNCTTRARASAISAASRSRLERSRAAPYQVVL